MRISIEMDTSRRIIAREAGISRHPDDIEVDDSEWRQFLAFETQHKAMLVRFESQMLQQRVYGLAELEQARTRVAELEARLNMKPAPASVAAARTQPQFQQPSPLSETDYGAGIGRDHDSAVTLDEFRDELAELRERTREKRARLA